MSQIGEYTVLPLTIPSTPAYPKPATHTLYLRPHAPKIPTGNDSRSLFLVNVPIDSTSAHIRAVIVSLLGAGRFESVSFEHEIKTQATLPTPVQAQSTNKKRKRGDADTVPEELPYTWNRKLGRSGSTAVVLLVDERSVENALKAARKISRSGKERSRPVWGGDGVADVPELGSKRYAAHQELRFPSREELQRNVDSFMTGFNALEEAKAKEAKRARNVPDADGFVTVVRGGSRTGPARVDERKRAEMEAKEMERREGLRIGGFYRFQVRERRKEEQGELVKRFEEDRRRVGEMKERRGRFRPEK